MIQKPLLSPKGEGGINLNRSYISPRKRVCVGAALVVVDHATAFIAGGEARGGGDCSTPFLCVPHARPTYFYDKGK